MAAAARSSTCTGWRRPVAPRGNGNRFQRRASPAMRVRLASRPTPYTRVGRSTVSPAPHSAARANNTCSACASRADRSRSYGSSDACLVSTLVEPNAITRAASIPARGYQRAKASSGPQLTMASNRSGSAGGASSSPDTQRMAVSASLFFSAWAWRETASTRHPDACRRASTALPIWPLPPNTRASRMGRIRVTGRHSITRHPSGWIACGPVPPVSAGRGERRLG